jgi:hypothetical protein
MDTQATKVGFLQMRPHSVVLSSLMRPHSAVLSSLSLCTLCLSAEEMCSRRAKTFSFSILYLTMHHVLSFPLFDEICYFKSITLLPWYRPEFPILSDRWNLLFSSWYSWKMTKTVFFFHPMTWTKMNQLFPASWYLYFLKPFSLHKEFRRWDKNDSFQKCDWSE